MDPNANEDGDLTLLLSIDSKKADIEFACSRGGQEEEEDEEEEEVVEEVGDEPEEGEEGEGEEGEGGKKPAKKPDSNFMVDLLRSGNSSLSLVELFKFKKAFYEADDNENGVLEWEEFRDAFHIISKVRMLFCCFRCFPWMADSCVPWPQDIPESDIMTWFAKIDGDCDGFVEWDECFNFLIAKVCGAPELKFDAPAASYLENETRRETETAMRERFVLRICSDR